MNDKIAAYSGACVGDACTAIEEDLDGEDIELQKMDFGVGVGLNHDISDHFSISTQYQFGLGNIFENEVDAYNNVLSFSITYTF